MLRIKTSFNAPHPFTDREALQSQILRILESQIAQIEDSAKPGDRISDMCAKVISKFIPVVSIRERQMRIRVQKNTRTGLCLSVSILYKAYRG